MFWNRKRQQEAPVTENPFPLVEDTSSKIAVIDIGSNSVRLVVYDSATRSPGNYFNEKVLCGLGAALETSGKLHPEGRVRAVAALRRFAALTKRMQVPIVDAVATAAVRDASDGPDFVAQVARETGLQIRVLSGEEEAQLSAQGVLLGEPRASGVVADMGGASMEIIRVVDGQIDSGVTTALGPLRVVNFTGDVKARIRSTLSAANIEGLAAGQPLYLVGGSARAIGAAHMRRVKYPLHVMHEYTVAPAAFMETAQWVSAQNPKSLRDFVDTSADRADVLPHAAMVFQQLIELTTPASIVISTFGLREGVLWSHLPESLRAQDPLLQPCRVLEQRRARCPGFGEELWHWLSPVLTDSDKAERRLIHAACILVDVSWRTHPDYRGKTSFEVITRSNFGGVDHEGRVFIGVALAWRSKDAEDWVALEPASQLLPPERHARAEAVGRGMRLGAMLSGATIGVLPQCPLERRGDKLIMSIGPEVADLAGEMVERRFRAFARALGLTPDLRVG